MGIYGGNGSTWKIVGGICLCKGIGLQLFWYMFTFYIYLQKSKELYDIFY